MLQACLLLFIILLTCCNTTTKEEVMVSPQQQAIWFISNENHRLFQAMVRNIEEHGNRPGDLAEKRKAAELLMERNAYMRGTLGADEYTAYLTNAFSETYEFDQEKTAQLTQLLEQYQQRKDTATYQEHLLSALLLENEVLQEIARRAGPFNVLHPPSAQLIKTIDTLHLGDTYEFSVIPAVYDYKKTTILPDTALRITLNGKPVEIENKLYLQSGILLGLVRPTEAGTYSISGSFTLTNPDYVIRVNSQFTDTFEVVAENNNN